MEAAGNEGGYQLFETESLADALAQALGVKAQPFPPAVCNQFTAPTSQAAYGEAVYLRKGTIVTGVALRNSVGAAGTAPTTARAAITDAAGKVLARSGNVNAAASWAGGVVKLPLSASYTIPADGLYYVCFVVNGTWGTTQPTPAFTTGTGAFTAKFDNDHPPPSFQWNGQADLPAVGASVSLAAVGRNYWIAAY